MSVDSDSSDMVHIRFALFVFAAYSPTPGSIVWRGWAELCVGSLMCCRWGNKLSNKLFAAKKYVLKHIHLKQEAAVAAEKEKVHDDQYHHTLTPHGVELLYCNWYVCRVSRVSLQLMKLCTTRCTGFCTRGQCKVFCNGAGQGSSYVCCGPVWGMHLQGGGA
jgi:hypothetical protein